MNGDPDAPGFQQAMQVRSSMQCIHWILASMHLDSDSSTIHPSMDLGTGSEKHACGNFGFGKFRIHAVLH